MPQSTFLTRDIGQAERRMRALLDRQLAEEGLSFPEWTVLAFLGDGPAPRSELVRRQLAGQVTDAPAAGAAVDRLLTGDLIAATTARAGVRPDDLPLEVTARGHAVVGPLRQTIAALTVELHSGLSTADVDATRRTLDHLAQRAQALLSQGARAVGGPVAPDQHHAD